MTKIQTLTFEYEHCFYCPEAGVHHCVLDKKHRKIDLWGKFPEWCPLPNKEENGNEDGKS